MTHRDQVFVCGHFGLICLSQNTDKQLCLATETYSLQRVHKLVETIDLQRSNGRSPSRDPLHSETMIGTMNGELSSKHGVNTIPKGDCAACGKPIIGQVSLGKDIRLNSDGSRSWLRSERCGIRSITRAANVEPNWVSVHSSRETDVLTARKTTTISSARSAKDATEPSLMWVGFSSDRSRWCDSEYNYLLFRDASTWWTRTSISNVSRVPNARCHSERRDSMKRYNSKSRNTVSNKIFRTARPIANATSSDCTPRNATDVHNRSRPTSSPPSAPTGIRTASSARYPPCSHFSLFSKTSNSLQRIEETVKIRMRGMFSVGVPSSFVSFVECSQPSSFLRLSYLSVLWETNCEAWLVTNALSSLVSSMEPQLIPVELVCIIKFENLSDNLDFPDKTSK